MRKILYLTAFFRENAFPIQVIKGFYTFGTSCKWIINVWQPIKSNTFNFFSKFFGTTKESRSVMEYPYRYRCCVLLSISSEKASWINPFFLQQARKIKRMNSYINRISIYHQISLNIFQLAKICLSHTFCNKLVLLIKILKLRIAFLQENSSSNHDKTSYTERIYNITTKYTTIVFA